MVPLPRWAARSLLVTAVLVTACQQGGSGSQTHAAAHHAICNRGTYHHIAGDFPEYGPPQTLYVGATPDGIGSVFRVQAPELSVVSFFIEGAGQLNYVFRLDGTSTDPARLLWRQQSDYDCRGVLTVRTDPADPTYTLYAAEPDDSAFALPSTSP